MQAAVVYWDLNAAGLLQEEPSGFRLARGGCGGGGGGKYGDFHAAQVRTAETSTPLVTIQLVGAEPVNKSSPTQVPERESSGYCEALPKAENCVKVIKLVCFSGGISPLEVSSRP
ncbi:hypothetical protein AXG93_4295s1200 [Marchantia polymorpha subsp. ruderalis]|uniref:Uncharacterized protein n=1 Tax=Marchantia polymorpha subsp. ruderalis TaxID=1480154 RepID=A0A176WD34_MARPO|nr:hypothetical protein AXG93_4295s1200 [Marchantia polymorpha subsp. ruderalis]